MQTKEQKKEYDKKRYPKIKEQRKEYYLKNREYIIKRQNEYNLRTWEHIKEYSRNKTRARIKFNKVNPTYLLINNTLIINNMTDSQLVIM